MSRLWHEMSPEHRNELLSRRVLWERLVDEHAKWSNWTGGAINFGDEHGKVGRLIPDPAKWTEPMRTCRVCGRHERAGDVANGLCDHCYQDHGYI